MSHALSPILEIGDEEEAQRQVEHFYASGRPISVLGAGHLLSNRASVGGVLLANKIRSRLELGPDATMVVSTGWKWSDVVEFAHRHGVTFPVLTSNLDTTVGGTLSAGGFGLTSHREGMQADHVLGCTIHTAAGVFQCRRSEDPLWRSSLCSLGTVGFVSSVVLAVRPPIDRVWLWERQDEPDQAVDVFLGAARAFEHRAALATCRFEYGTATTRLGFLELQENTPPQLPTGRMRSLDYATLLLQSTVPPAPVRRVWNDFILPVEQAGVFLAVALEQLRRAERNPRIVRKRLRLLSIGRTARSNSSFFLRPTVLDRSQTIGVGFYLDVALDDLDSLQVADEQQSVLTSACRAAGGAPYLAGEIRMSQAECRSAFGPDWTAFEAARQRYDPKGLFGMGNTLPY